jgi:hypothetical protein
MCNKMYLRLLTNTAGIHINRIKRISLMKSALLYWLGIILLSFRSLSDISLLNPPKGWPYNCVKYPSRYPSLFNFITALRCTALHCTALHCTALHCTAHCPLHCSRLDPGLGIHARSSSISRVLLHCNELLCNALQ